jgi:hypothetical protein
MGTAPVGLAHARFAGLRALLSVTVRVTRPGG